MKRALLCILFVTFACSDDGSSGAGGQQDPLPEDAGLPVEDAGGGDDAGPLEDTGPENVDADAEPSDTPQSDVDGPVEAPLISEALDCTRPGAAGGLNRGDELQRHDIDTEVFPDAVCNDNTPAVFYFRPFEGEMNRDRWVIQLQGGGGCRSGQLCANRWCSKDTNFGAQQMSADFAPEGGINGVGVLSRRAENPVGNANQVFIRYCSSDGWSGTTRNVVVEATHPVREEEPVAFRMSFSGVAIIDAVLDTLRRDGVEPLNYTLAGGAQDMPDLDDASFVFFMGASAGGGGVTLNADRVGQKLRSTNTRCEGQSCALNYRALMDSSFGPSIERLDFSQTTLCLEAGICDHETFLQINAENSTALQGTLTDASCLDDHQDEPWRCFDSEHLVQHHITTPFFVRMGQSDSLKTRNFEESGFRFEGMAFSLSWFSALVREQLTGLADIQRTAHEGDAIEVAPGFYGPTCDKHETLRNNPHTFNVNIRSDGENYAMFDVIRNWLTGERPAGLVAENPSENFCP